jgi:hypothetical protein
VNSAANETGEAADRVMGAVGTLGEQSDALRKEIESFLNGVKAA